MPRGSKKSSETALVCATCQKSTPGSFIECDTCKQWYHQQCQFVSYPENEEDIEWSCRTCVKALITPDRSINEKNGSDIVLSSLKKKRDMIKGQIRVHTDYVMHYDPERNNVENLESRLEMLDEISAEFRKIHGEIQEYVDADDKDEVQDATMAYNLFSDEYCSVKGAIKKKIKENMTKPLTNVRAPDIAKLPPVPIPDFSGDVKDWVSFRDTFQAIVINQGISEVVKLHYLRESLKAGDAWKLISEIKPSDEAFAVAWQTIEKRYNNTNVIVDSHVSELFKLKSVSGENAKDLWKLVETCGKHLKALESLGEPVKHWDTLIIHMIKFRLDDVSKSQWETGTISMKNRPKWSDMENFLMDRCRVLESLDTNKRRSATRPKPFVDKKTNAFLGNSNRQDKCEYCGFSHKLADCRKFSGLKIAEKQEVIKKCGLCFKCLIKGHLASSCDKTCEICKGTHHKVIHFEKSKQNEPEKDPKTTLTSVSISSEILLMTAKIRIKSATGEWIEARALLDGGSQSCFITEKLSKKLKIEGKQTNISVQGIVGKVGKIFNTIATEIKSKKSQYKKSLEFLVIPQIVERSPHVKINFTKWKLPAEISMNLADDCFAEPGDVDILLGVEVFLETLLMEKRELNGEFPIFQKTEFGWVVGGRCEVPKEPSRRVLTYTSTIDLDQELKKFWEINSYEKRTHLTAEEKEATQHFEETCKRGEDGKYTVRIPFKQDELKNLGNSKIIALKRFDSTEKRLMKNEDLRKQYISFMDEYEELGHMTKVKEPSGDDCYFLPHHPVLKPDSTTTQMRVVFSASERTSTGVTLNQIQLVGAVVQDSLFNIQIRARKYPIALSADVEKMFRVISVDPRDRKYQMIVWRRDPSAEIEFFELNTVTYGMASSPHLSADVLDRLKKDEAHNFPKAAEAMEDLYVDNYMGGAYTLEEALELVHQLIEIFKSAQMNLRKWSSNRPEVLESLPEKYIENPKCFEDSSANETIKTLGLIWYPVADQYAFQVPLSSSVNVKSKRQLLSEILKLFDPMGYLSPVIVVARLLMQELWLLKISWDEDLPEQYCERWRNYAEQLCHVRELRLTRCVCPSANPKRIELHAFSDASERAYGACCYLKVIDESGGVHVNLLCSKFRVAPLKKRSLPQLELCGALLMCQLVAKLLEAMKMKIDEVFVSTDSMITLCWIQTPSHKLKTFVANRVSDIQELDAKFKWRHVPTKLNPADLLTRGVPPSELKDSDLWWHGPKYLFKTQECWPAQPQQLIIRDLPDVKPDERFVFASTMIGDILEDFSSVRKLQRIIAYCRRFIHNKFNKDQPKLTGFLSQRELQSALKCLIRLDQQQHFTKEYHQLKRGERIDSNSSIKSLNPFMDADGLIRVGGRLKSSKLNYDSRHQMLLSKDSELTKKLVVEEHRVYGHVGPQTLLFILRQRFWPIHGKQLIRILLRKCIICAKLNPKRQEQFMGDLPVERVELIHPFYATGCDYAGPFMIKEGGIRSKKFTKSWVAVFVCMATKSVHLELVLEMTSVAFIQALVRFTARRGKPKIMHSDNGTNFVGANNQLKEIATFLNEKENQEGIDKFCAEEGIQWKFIPPRSPSMGGEWEAAVKSFKYHFYRIAGQANLTVIEFQTILCKIESILNSRPLFPESADPNDLTAITPGHFLIGRPLIAIAEVDWSEANINRLARYERVQQASQHFWIRFHQDYLNSLQNRTKAYKGEVQIKVGQLVVLVDENAKPLLWHMARVIEVHPGKDGIVRVITVKTKNGVYKRAVNKVCLLPVETE